MQVVQKMSDIFGYFCKKICCHDLPKIAKSGHTGCIKQIIPARNGLILNQFLLKPVPEQPAATRLMSSRCWPQIGRQRISSLSWSHSESVLMQVPVIPLPSIVWQCRNFFQTETCVDPLTGCHFLKLRKIASKLTFSIN